MRAIAPYRKAILAGIAAGIAAAIPLVDDGLTAAEILRVALAALGGGGVVYAVPNSPDIQE